VGQKGPHWGHGGRRYVSRGGIGFAKWVWTGGLSDKKGGEDEEREGGGGDVRGA